VTGVVSEFDDDVGLGTITSGEGAAYPFHCTQIADGTRTIAVGTAVTFAVIGRLGRYEASDIAPSNVSSR
jgi:cold shock CspA family protein